MSLSESFGEIYVQTALSIFRRICPVISTHVVKSKGNSLVNIYAISGSSGLCDHGFFLYIFMLSIFYFLLFFCIDERTVVNI